MLLVYVLCVSDYWNTDVHRKYIANSTINTYAMLLFHCIQCGRRGLIAIREL